MDESKVCGYCHQEVVEATCLCTKVRDDFRETLKHSKRVSQISTSDVLAELQSYLNLSISSLCSLLDFSPAALDQGTKLCEDRVTMLYAVIMRAKTLGVDNRSLFSMLQEPTVTEDPESPSLLYYIVHEPQSPFLDGNVRDVANKFSKEMKDE